MIISKNKIIPNMKLKFYNQIHNKLDHCYLKKIKLSLRELHNKL